MLPICYLDNFLTFLKLPKYRKNTGAGCRNRTNDLLITNLPKLLFNSTINLFILKILLRIISFTKF